jgi:4-hydroxythreonine-4-phosphate dehydrogenase
MTDASAPAERPVIALTLGDPAGIGPEVALAAARDGEVRARMRLVLIGPERLRPHAISKLSIGALGAWTERRDGTSADSVWIATTSDEEWETGKAQASAGRIALHALRIGHELAIARTVSALVTAPVSKTALHLAGERVEGQTELLGRWCGVNRHQMMAVAGSLRVMLLTRHMPLRRALDEITFERVLDHLRLLHETLRRMGFDRPRIALAGLNPHAGEGGLLGSEDQEMLLPAVEAARSDGLIVSGPVSPDSVFAQALGGAFDGVLALYHDQAFIPVKLLARDRGVTLIAGLPYLRVSPVHGTAFEIAGKGLASTAPMVGALLQAAEWSRRAR